MSTPSGFDDLAGLMSEADLAPASYQTFSASPKKAQPVTEPASAHAEPRMAAARSEAARVHVLTVRANREMEAGAPGPEDAQAVRDAGLRNLAVFSSWGSWNGLDLIFGGDRAGEGPRRLEGTRHCSFAIAGVSGGVGATTVTTALARLCTKGGNRALVLDPTPSSVLPLYFGGRSTRLQLSSFVLPGDPKGSALHICRRTDTYANDAVGTWARGAIESLAEDTDSLFIDAGQTERNRFFTEVGGNLIRIVVITPETRCLARLVELEQELSEGRGAPETGRPLLLLNQFDPSDSLHVEIRSRLERRFTGRLIPIAIRYGREISTALAEGGTVFDYAPQSTVAGDFRRLYEWLEGSGPQQERIALQHQGQSL